MVNNHRKSFIRLFNETARYHHRYEVFRDFVMMSGISIHNAVARSEELEQEYLNIVGRYKKDDVNRITKLFAEFIMGLELAHSDFLGSIFMELELGSDRMGQFFTPYSISKLMAKLTNSGCKNILQEKPFITLLEPACGSGGMVIAFSEIMLEEGFNPQTQLWVSCTDIDPVAAMMCYLQLALLHIPAEVITGNTITLEYSRVMRTPAHYLGLWDYKLGNNPSNDSQKTNEVAVTEEVSAIIVNPQSREATITEQMTLFDVAM